MAHEHNVYNEQLYFSIDPATRKIFSHSDEKVSFIQNDHNSQRIAFGMPRYVEGHDMSLCSRVEVHYLNVDAKTKSKNTGLYEVTDMAINTEDENIVNFSWLISQNATKLIGTLNFLIRFICIDEGGNIVYAWHTAICTEPTVQEGMCNTEIIVEQYADVLEQWRQELKGQQVTTGAYLPLAGGTLTGKLQAQEVAVGGKLNVAGVATFNERVNLNSTLDLNGGDIVEVKSITMSGTTRTHGDLITYAVKPNETDIYNIGSSSKHYKNAYVQNIFAQSMEVQSIMHDDSITIASDGGNVEILTQGDGYIDIRTEGSNELILRSDDNEVKIHGGVGVTISSDGSDGDGDGHVTIAAKMLNLGTTPLKYGTPVAINNTFSAIPITNTDGVKRYMLLGTSIEALTSLVNALSSADE